jgi:hypothetical protein
VTSAWPTHVAVVAKLKAAPAVTVPVYDGRGVPHDAAMPYITLGSVYEVPDDTHSDRGNHVHVTLHVWSNYRGTKEAHAIASVVDTVLDRQPLTVAGHTDVSVAREYSSVVDDPNPDICHINARYRVWLTKT